MTRRPAFKWGGNRISADFQEKIIPTEMVYRILSAQNSIDTLLLFSVPASSMKDAMKMHSITAVNCRLAAAIGLSSCDDDGQEDMRKGASTAPPL